MSLSLRPECRVARDSGVVRLFVEYSVLDLPTEETPLSLPKPPQGKSINFNYSKGKDLHLVPDLIQMIVGIYKVNSWFLMGVVSSSSSEASLFVINVLFFISHEPC